MISNADNQHIRTLNSDRELERETVWNYQMGIIQSWLMSTS